MPLINTTEKTRKVIDGKPFYVVPKGGDTLTNPRTNEVYRTDGDRVYIRGRVIGRLERFS
ncbi:MAG: hypothetical protein WC494_00410 [Candidatus Pacearchaeota archaeon]